MKPWRSSLGLGLASLVLSCGVLLAPCFDTRSSAQRAPAPPSLAAALAALPSATVVDISDRWSGLSPIAPLDDRYRLVRVGATFEGSVTCGARGESVDVRDLAIDAASVTPLLTRLASVTTTRGRYVPLWQHTDDMPNRSLTLQTASGLVSFASRSQGRFSAPWELAVGGRHRIVASTIPGEVSSALAALLGPDRCDAWRRMLPTRPRAPLDGGGPMREDAFDDPL